MKAWSRRSMQGAPWFAWMTLCGAFYALGTMMEIHAVTPLQVLACLGLEYAGIAFIGPVVLLTALSIGNDRARFRSRWTGLLLVIPVLTFALVITNDLHHLYWNSIGLSFQEGFTIPLYLRGPAYWVYLIYTNACLMGGFGIFAVNTFRSPRGFRAQNVALLAGSIFPWIGMILYQSGLSPLGLDTAPIGLVGSCILFAWGLFRHQLFDLNPLLVNQVLTNLNEGILVTDNRGRVLTANPALRGIFDQATIPPNGRELTDREVTGFLDGPGSREARIGTRYFQVDRSPLRSSRGRITGWILNFTDISATALLNRRLAELSRTDDLTGLPNRRAFMEGLRAGLGHSARRTEPLSLVMLDLDHFKQTNDTWGHLAGDAVLCHLAATGSTCLRAGEQLYRYGGEEFAILLTGTDNQGAMAVAGRMRQALEASPLAKDGALIRVTASFGVATLHPPLPESAPRSGEWVDLLIRHADNALYRAKDAGRNRVENEGTFSPPG